MTIYPIHWLYQQFVGNVSQGDALCYLCGFACSKDYTVNKGIADTFNSHYLARCPSSHVLCPACWWYFNDKKEHPEFRMMSLVVGRERWQNWERSAMKADITRWLTSGLEADSYLVVSLSKKKHILLQAPINTQYSKMLAIQVEEQVAHLSLTAWQQIETPFMKLLELGHNKGEILSGTLYGQTLKKHGRITEALMYNQNLDLWRKSPQIELLSYVTIVEKGEQVLDGSGDRPNRTEPTTIREGIRGQAGSSRPAQVHMEWDRQGIPEQVSHGDLANVRGESGGVSKDYEQLSLFSE